MGKNDQFGSSKKERCKMQTIGFPISHKENEYRRAIVLEDIKKFSHPDLLYFEEGFGRVLGIEDNEFRNCGCHVCNRLEVLKKDIICDPKIGDADYLSNLHNQSIFGWIHATQHRDITDIIVNNKITAYAWEKMYEFGRHVFWFNNELAGEAAIIHAFQCFGKLPYGLNVAVIGRGNTARGAIKVLNMLGSKVIQYDRNTENLLRKELSNYDVIVNCVLWDVTRKDHIIYKKDLEHMKKDSMIIDVSCDKNGGIETCIPTTIENPVYYFDGILHYAVDHTPSIFHKTFSYNNSKVILPYLEELSSGYIGDVLKSAIIVDKGKIIDDEIIKYQGRNNSI